MTKAGYSGKLLIEKLGIRHGMKILLINEPDNYVELLGKNLQNQKCIKNELPDLVHLFVKTMKEFEKEMKKLNLIRMKNSKIIIWVSWYKKTAKISTDMTEDVIRNYALINSLVDVKVCSINETWSGLKLVVPLAKR